MPVYKPSSRITVPSNVGVLSDVQYSELTPTAYKLDNAISECDTVLSEVEDYFGGFLTSYKTLVSSIDTDLGINFFSINNQDLNIVDGSSEIEKVTTTTTNVEESISNIKNQMSSINDKLDEVEAALNTMLTRYGNRKAEVDTAWEKCRSFESTKPIIDNYNSNSNSYSSDLSKWQSEYNELEKTARNLESQLKSDTDKTYKEINISWFCNAKQGE